MAIKETLSRKFPRVQNTALLAFERLGLGRLVAHDEWRYGGYRRSTLARRPFVNIGAGGFEHRYWTNVDFDSDWYARTQTAGFVQHDLSSMQPLPFEDESVELAYTSHTIEHVPAPAVSKLFAECHRVLVPGGAVRVTCPDARLIYDTLARESRGYWKWREPWFGGQQSTAGEVSEVRVEDFVVRELATPRGRFYRRAKVILEPGEVRRRFDALGYRAFLDWLTEGLEFDPTAPGDHISWWDEDRVAEELQRAGFSDVRRSRRGQSLFPPMADTKIFDAKSEWISLYIEATKR